MYKIKSFIDLDKEEKWLSDMSAQGWFLGKRGAFGGYSFFQAEPQRTNFKIDYREFTRSNDYQDYQLLMHDAGWIQVAGSRWSGSQYFVPADGDASKQLFSDSASKAARYRRLSQMWITLLIVYLVLLLSLTLNGLTNFSAFFNPSELYFTPGLWEKEGISFWFSFLFETPFAFMRGYAWLFIPLFMVFCMYYLIKLRSLAHKTKKENTQA